MTTMPTQVASADNAVVKRIRALQRDGASYKKSGDVWLEGDHLCRAAHQRGLLPSVFTWSEAAWQRCAQALGTDAHASATWSCAQAATHQVVLSDKLWAELSGLESFVGMAALFTVPPSSASSVLAQAPTVVVDRVQDPGNLGSIIRSAAAMGFAQVLAIKGTVAMWSPKVVRAGMGAHFALNLVEGLQATQLDQLQVPLLVTSSHQGDWLHKAQLPWPCAWVMGHEGQGVAPAIAAMASQQVRITQPGGEESLNVAAAAAVCLHASAAALALTAD
ncbi:RNA methyltransferase [Comamonadaceae bacterium M7527]|nr:RNA methyltransferase [Comamonadaceae bacterium M7527]